MLSPRDLAGRRGSFLCLAPSPPPPRVDWVWGAVPWSRAGPSGSQRDARDSAGRRRPPPGSRPRSAAVGTRPWRWDSRRGPSALGGCEWRRRAWVPSCERPPSLHAARGLGQVGEESLPKVAPGRGACLAGGGRVWALHVTRPGRTWPASPDGTVRAVEQPGLRGPYSGSP